ncbi:MAG TPA: HPr family phosphocarrier protein [Kiritimatiellia bacterium]|nr:HPr family phosphocarrier protein [Kiritimatiellia bacterium]
MIAKNIHVNNAHGLHMRVAGELIRLARTSGSKIVLKREDTNQTAVADSILDLLLLEVTPGTELDVQVEGPGEEFVVVQVQELFEGGSGI